jgi:hypothetical protein
VAVLGVGIVAVACAAPSRRLTPRVVEDPIVLPRRLASLALSGGIARYEPSGARSFWSEGRFRMGITDRLEWTDVTSLRYALLDDRPAGDRPPHRLSLAIQAGFRGIGYSSSLGMLLMPIAAVQTLKHLGDRWAVGLSVTWQAIWMQKPPGEAFWYTQNLGYTAGRRSFWSLSAFVTRQLSEHFALSLGGWATRAGACLSPTCAWITQSTGGSLNVVFRPRHWMTVHAGPYAGLRYRPDTPPPQSPIDPVAVPPVMVEWFGVSGGATFYW